MKREEHASILASILSGRDDQAIVSDSLTTLSEDYAGMLADLELTRGENESLKKRNDDLTAQNMKLFLKVGNVPEPEAEAETEKKRTYEDLFDEFGHLK